MKVNQVHFSIAAMCRRLGVSSSGYYAWRTRGPSARAREDAALTDRIKSFHKRSRGTYGAPRIHQDLAEEGIRVGPKRVARLMKAEGLQGVSRRKGTRTTIRKEGDRPAPDLVDRNYSVTEPDTPGRACLQYPNRWGNERSCTMFLNVTPDLRGLIPDSQVEVLREFGDLR